MMRRSIRWAVPLAALLGTAPAASIAAAPRCDSGTALTLLGIDTAARHLLFAFTTEREQWLADLRLDQPAARVVQMAPGSRRHGVSVGAGPMLAASSCGSRCVQVLRWSGARWEPFGEPLRASDKLSMEGTWDGTGQPWVALLGPGGAPGTLAATAYRMEGSRWVEKGGLAVQAVGSPALAPSPSDSEAVVVGTGRFHARHRPEHWLAGLPGLEAAALGQVVPWGDGGAAFFRRDAPIQLSRDGGRSWQEIRRLPWSNGEGDLAWRPGRHFWVDLPEGNLAPPLGTLWVDSRTHRRQLYVVELSADGSWRTLFQGPDGILTEDGQRLEFLHVVRFAADHWLLLSGCVARQEGGALAFREIREGRVGPPEVLPLMLSPP